MLNGYRKSQVSVSEEFWKLFLDANAAFVEAIKSECQTVDQSAFNEGSTELLKRAFDNKCAEAKQTECELAKDLAHARHWLKMKSEFIKARKLELEFEDWRREQESNGIPF